MVGCIIIILHSTLFIAENSNKNHYPTLQIASLRGSALHQLPLHHKFVQYNEGANFDLLLDLPSDGISAYQEKHQWCPI
jgi:hypothetical protein